MGSIWGGDRVTGAEGTGAWCSGGSALLGLEAWNGVQAGDAAAWPANKMQIHGITETEQKLDQS